MQDFRSRVRQRDTLLGTLVTLGAPQVSELFALAGFDWLWIDQEHAPLAADQVQQHVQAVAGRAGTVVRVPWNDPVSIKQALDTGCDGVLVPQVRTVDEARRAVAASRYPPVGERSVGIARAHGYGMTHAEYVRAANDTIAVFLQIEHISALPRLDEILAVPDVDAVVVGPYDLSASVGRPGEWTHPDVVAAIATVADTCRRMRMPWGAFAPDSASARSFVHRGATLVAIGLDITYLWKGGRAALAEVRASPNLS